jgi:hypothetical protein
MSLAMPVSILVLAPPIEVNVCAGISSKDAKRPSMTSFAFSVSAVDPPPHAVNKIQEDTNRKESDLCMSQKVIYQLKIAAINRVIPLNGGITHWSLNCL